MFKTLPDGVEIYFAWPSRTARIVPNGSVKSGIVLRDNALRTFVALMALIAALLQEKSLTIGLAMGVLGVAVFVKRNRYLSNLSKTATPKTPIAKPIVSDFSWSSAAIRA